MGKKVISRSSLTKMINEELDRYINEDVFGGVKDLDGVKAWIVRQWFNPEKNAGKPWYDPTVNKDNVLTKLVKNPKFPLGVKQLKDMWKNMPIIRQGLNAPPPNANGGKPGEEVSTSSPATSGGIYKTGEKSLSSIGKQLGDVSATMIKKLGDKAEERIKSFYGTASPYDMSQEDEDDLFDRIDSARKEAASDYSLLLKASKGNIKNFLGALVKAQIISPKEVNLISPDEIQGLTLLSTKDREVIEDVLMDDIDEDNNTFKTYQNAVSKKVFVPAKRGRKPKQA